MHLKLWVCIYIHTCTYMHEYVSICTHVQKQACSLFFNTLFIYVNMLMQACMHSHTQTHLHTPPVTCMTTWEKKKSRFITHNLDNQIRDYPNTRELINTELSVYPRKLRSHRVTITLWPHKQATLVLRCVTKRLAWGALLKVLHSLKLQNRAAI